MSEAQKYEGPLYKEKATHSKTGDGANQDAQRKHAAKETPRRVSFAVLDDTPRVPGAMPPSRTTADAVDGNKGVNVFEYLVSESTPVATKSIKTMDQTGEGRGKGNGGSLGRDGFSYGADPVRISVEDVTRKASSVEFETPVPKGRKLRSRGETKQPTDKQHGSDKKRKRHAGDVDVGTSSPAEAPSSTKNNVGTPILQHSGLTGGLDRMLRDEDDNAEGHYRDASSPIKRTRRGEKETSREARKARAERLVSSMFGMPGGRYDATSKAMVRPSRKASHQLDSQAGQRYELQQNGRSAADRAHDDEVAQYQRAGQFLSLITKGPESARGMSVHKVLKRLHGQYEDAPNDETDMWRVLRTKRNERGEIVLFL